MYYSVCQGNLTKNKNFVIITKKGVVKLDKMQYKETQSKSLRIETELVKKIEELAEKNERDFTKQVIFMLKKYIEITENQ